MNNLNQHDKYIKGEMSENQLDAFTKKILKKHHDKELKDKWNSLLKQEHGYELPKTNDDTSESTEIKKEISSESAPTQPAGKIRTMYKALAVAAGFLLVLGMYFFSMQPTSSNTELLAASYLAEPYPYGEVRKGEVEISEKRRLAGELYTRRVYDLSSAAYLEIVQLDAVNDEDYFFLGLSELYNQDYQNAVVHLSEVLNGKEDQYKRDATWYLSLAHLKANNKNKAKNLLSTIAKWGENSDSRARDKKTALQAKALLKSLE